MSIIFKQTRIGKNCRPFTLYKFRTMVEGADKMGGPSTAGDDPRLTKIGGLLRKFRIDEIPQFWNILKREMNIVGPRPDVPYYVYKMTQEERDIILSVRPGLTDLATLWDYNEADSLKGKIDPERYFEEYIWPKKKLLQIEYIKNRSLWLDLKIIWWTILKILRGK